jgi:hypothetical protein
VLAFLLSGCSQEKKKIQTGAENPKKNNIDEKKIDQTRSEGEMGNDKPSLGKIADDKDNVDMESDEEHVIGKQDGETQETTRE